MLILVKTYPTASKKYNELVCTAGLTEFGEWIRIYPVDFRKLPRNQKYKKYQWIEAEYIRDKQDPRKESFKLVSEIKTLNIICTCNKWQDRKEKVLENVYFNKETLLMDSKIQGISLAIFKPALIKSFEVIEGTKALDFKFYYRFLDNEGKSSRLRI